MEVAPRPPPLVQEFGGNTIGGARLPFAAYISCPGTDESPGTRLWPHQPVLTSRSRSESRGIGLHIPRSSPDGYPSPAEAGNDRVYALAQSARYGPRAGHIEPIGARLHPGSVAVLEGIRAVPVRTALHRSGASSTGPSSLAGSSTSLGGPVRVTPHEWPRRRAAGPHQAP